MAFDFDLVVIGAGSGGTRASRLSAGYGARVAVVEESRLGGTCVNLGCIPKKLFVYAAHYGEDFADAAAYGWEVGAPRFDFARLRKNKDVEIARLNGVYARLLDEAGVTRIDGRARLVDAHTVAVGKRRITAEHILVATGGWPRLPLTPGIEHAITSNEVFALERLPERVVIVGGGYIAVEFASIFHGLGVETTLSYRGERLLREFDADLGAFLGEQMAKKGVRVLLHSQVRAIERRGQGLACAMADGSVIETDAVMYATGRMPNTRGLGLEGAGVALDRNGAVIVDENFQSSVASIHAIGDVIHRLQLTPVALAEGMVIVDRLFAGGQRRMSYSNIATAIFSNPNVGSVGLTEARARQEHGDVAIYRTSFTPLKHRLTGRAESTLMKLVVDKATDRVLGVHMVGAEAGEIIQGFAVALVCGATKRQFDATIGIHPTAAEELVTLRDPVA